MPKIRHSKFKYEKHKENVIPPCNNNDFLLPSLLPASMIWRQNSKTCIP